MAAVVVALIGCAVRHRLRAHRNNVYHNFRPLMHPVADAGATLDDHVIVRVGRSRAVTSSVIAVATAGMIQSADAAAPCPVELQMPQASNLLHAILCNLVVLCGMGYFGFIKAPRLVREVSTQSQTTYLRSGASAARQMPVNNYNGEVDVRGTRVVWL